MSFFLHARRRMACAFVFALALSGPVVAAPPAIPISYTEALQRALANAPTLQVRRSQIDASTEEAATEYEELAKLHEAEAAAR